MSSINIYILWLLLFAPFANHVVAQSNQVDEKSPCNAKGEHHQLDFWIGEWNVTSEGRAVATSSIQRIIGGCVVFENYSQAEGFAGESFTFYDSTLKQWQQTWVDNTGTVSEFTGSFKDGAMRLEGVTHRNTGITVMRRMVLTPM